MGTDVDAGGATGAEGVCGVTGSLVAEPPRLLLLFRSNIVIAI
ncbi:MAG: hypothetical protein V7711_12565 [Pseudomonadales bacterium]